MVVAVMYKGIDALGYFFPITYVKAKAPVACPEGKDEFILESFPYGRSLLVESLRSAQVRIPPAIETVESFVDSCNCSSPRVYRPSKTKGVILREPISVKPFIVLSMKGEDRSSLILRDR